MITESILFTIIFALLLLHEMDAIRAKEWKMFFLLKTMAEKTAYTVFTALHLPIYFVAIYIMLCGGTASILVLQIIVDIFLILHAIIHFCFRKHTENGFKSLFSKTVIYSMAVLSMIHLVLLFF